VADEKDDAQAVVVVSEPKRPGSWSIKSVLPTVAPDLDYADLDDLDGGAAHSEWLEVIAPGAPDEDRESLKDGLLEYCARDTWAMVCLAHAFDIDIAQVEQGERLVPVV